ncbi:transcription termination factor NusA [Candidatus Liberibacter americanus]|uniref:Transcription termination/antitermination protein NusA n=1 Tax=Candidatus Liberibacter americanus str. Sao Paulo TaxID=1261131 RepID=U6B6P6_9HYPH|nr:transcription termination factor NusA [Candidatus Liberibacter americanus]AHA27546.1 Transcription elongation factor [Candidatus Liberibacter americanus str. Sao Paulo]EMS36493.1 transcription elongation factor NusA [Candidatus Liberibacter americanus PW_SP]
MVIAANRTELLQIADAVACEKSIDRDIVLSAMADSIQKAACSLYGTVSDIRVEIDQLTGEVSIYRQLEVVDVVDNYSCQISLQLALDRDPNVKIGDFITELLPPIDFGRVAVQSAKQVIVQKVREAERDRQYLEFKDRVGEVVSGTVKRIEYGNIIVDLGRAEGVIRRDEIIPRENIRQGDRVRSYVYEVRREQRGGQILLSRTHPQFMVKLFLMEVPEIYNGIVQIKAVSRDPGSRAKLAVFSSDSSIDPVGACVGMRGSRVQAVVGELQGERIDIIVWSPDNATFLINALRPATVTKVVLDEDIKRIEVVVPKEQLSLAIGSRGQNVRLASQLTGWAIDIVTEEEDSVNRQKEFNERAQSFMKAINVDEIIGHLLAAEGFSDVEELACVSIAEIASIEGFDEETAVEIQGRAKQYLDDLDAEINKKLDELGVSEELCEIPYMTPKIRVLLGENGIKNMEDLAGCSVDDLVGWVEVKDGKAKKFEGFLSSLDIIEDKAEDMIMHARYKVGWIKKEDESTDADYVEADD